MCHLVIFGEVVPQSICVRYGLPIGAWMAPCVLVLMYMMSPVAWPVAKLLDKLLGEDHGIIYKKDGLKTLVTLHKTLGQAEEQLNSDEVTIISAVLDLKDKSVGSIMTPMDDVFTMATDTILDQHAMDLILSQGYSRIPIHSPDNSENFLGMLLVKMLITYDPEDCKRVRDFALATLPETRPETSCLDIVNFFQEGKSHMVLVSEYPGEDQGALGVVTLEDVIEELIGEYAGPNTLHPETIQLTFVGCREIIDESDVFVDVHKAIRRMAPAPKSRVPKGVVHEDSTHQPLPEDGLSENGGDRTSVENRRSSVEVPPPRFQMRVQNPSKDSDDHLVTRVGTTDEIREQLKHLGPSNLASRPRQTRYQSVKIKRGRGSPSRSSYTDMDSSHSASLPVTPHPASTSALLQSNDGKKDTKMDSPALSANTDMDSPQTAPLSKHIASTTPLLPPPAQDDNNNNGYGSMQNGANRPAAKSNPPPLAIPPVVNEEDDSSRSGKSSSRGHATSKSIELKHDDISQLASTPARSGAITEHVVDVNGVRKVVLHANSSSSSDSEVIASRHLTDEDRKRDEQQQRETQESSTNAGGSSDQSQSGGQNSHKKRRRRRRSRRKD